MNTHPAWRFVHLVPVLVACTSTPALSEYTAVIRESVVRLQSTDSGQAPDLDAVRQVLAKPILPPGAALKEMQRFLESHIPGIRPPPSAAEWSRQAAALRKRFLKEIVYRGVPKEWYVGKARVQWLLDDGRWTMDGS